MNFIGKIENIMSDWKTGKMLITFSLEDKSALAEVESLKDARLSVEAKKWRNRRSIDANRMLWASIGEIAKVLNADKWEIYLSLLKRYGEFTYICIKQKALETFKVQWRECEVIGEVEIGGEKAVQLLCYFGSHTYDTKQFSRLLQGTIDEMKELGIQPPPSEDMRRALELWEKSNQS